MQAPVPVETPEDAQTALGDDTVDKTEVEAPNASTEELATSVDEQAVEPAVMSRTLSVLL